MACAVADLQPALHHSSAVPQRDLGGPVKADDSFWTLDEGELQIQLSKAEEGATWASAIAGAGRQAWLPCW